MEFPKHIALVVGLGNPGEDYARTYHNTGVLALHELARGVSFSPIAGKRFAYAKHKGYIFIQPLTLMNTSGTAVKNALRYFKIKPEVMLVAHDDSDIESGKWRLDFGRGSAGHRGVASIIETLGTKNFWRFRIGIRGKKWGRSLKRRKAGTFVLQPISPEDRKSIYLAIEGFTTKFTENVKP